MQDPVSLFDSDTDTDVDDSIAIAVASVKKQTTPRAVKQRRREPAKNTIPRAVTRQRMQLALDEAWQIHDEHRDLGLLRSKSNDAFLWPGLRRIAKDYGVSARQLCQFMRTHCRTYPKNPRGLSSHILTKEEELELFEWLRLNDIANDRRTSIREICDRANEIIQASPNPEGRGVFYFQCWNRMYKRFAIYRKQFGDKPLTPLPQSPLGHGASERSRDESRKRMQAALDEIWRLYNEDTSEFIGNKTNILQRTAAAFGVSHWTLRKHFTAGSTVVPSNKLGDNNIRILTVGEQRQLFDWIYENDKQRDVLAVRTRIPVKEICEYANQLIAQSLDGHTRPVFYYRCWQALRKEYIQYVLEKHAIEEMKCNEVLSDD